MRQTGYPSIDKLHEKGHSFFEKHPIVPNMSIYNMMKMVNIMYGKRTAIDCLNLRITYKKLFEISKIISEAFIELGIKENDIIPVSMPNFAQAVAIFLAANRIGATISFLNPGCTDTEIKYYINLFESKLFINYDKTIEYNRKMIKNTKLRQIITLDQRDLNKSTFDITGTHKVGNSDFISFSELELISEYCNMYYKAAYSGRENALILFTSGSTGTPKSVVLTNKNIIASGIYMKNTGRIKGKLEESCLVCVPFGYPYGFSTSTLMTLLCGRTAILAPNLDHTNVNDALRKNPNYIFGSPAVLEMMKRSTEENLDLSSVHSFVSGGDFLTPEEAERGIEFFKEHGANVEFYNGSGNAESAATSTMAIGSKIRRETVGKPLVGSTAIVIDSQGKELKYGEEGELCISGDHIFKEYYKEHELTKKAILIYKGKRYLRTGAIGFLDEEGYFTMTGRKSRFKILSDGNKLYPEHLKQFLSKIECVEKCAAVAKPNDETLWESKAYIVLKKGYKPTERLADLIIEELRMMVIKQENQNTNNLLKTFEIPKSITFVDEIPLLPSDKEDYSLLEKWAEEEYKEEKRQKKIGGIK